MQRRNRWIIVALVLAGLQLGACAQTSTEASKPKPAVVEPIAGTELNRVVLTEKAAERLQIATAPVQEETLDGAQRRVIPYAALLYDLTGGTWAYTNPEPLTFVRQQVTVDHIDGDKVFLSDGPPVGTAVVTVGVAELYGTDTGIGK